MTAHQAHFRCGGFTFKQEGDAIPTELRRALEKVLSSDLSSVRLQMNPDLEGLGALACMQGENIYLSPSAPAIDTPAGVAVLGHELAHVLQQRAGRVCARACNLVVEDEALEREADQVGLHCAARVFPGLLSDPGMPSTARGWERLAPGSEPAPIQFLITSQQSFDDFVAASWTYLGTPLTQQLSVPHVLNAMYNWAAAYNPNHVAPKNRLQGQPLYLAMSGYIRATVPNTIRMQTAGAWPNITNQVNNFDNYYIAKANGQNPPVNNQAEVLTQAYLHVYPNQQAPVNWRIALNVLPSDMAVAMAALAPMLNQYANMGHMKFLGPGDASKADSVIVYCNRNNGDYPQLRQAVLAAAGNLNFQARVGAMWEEIAPGIGLAAEPAAPFNAASFTQFRCLVVYLAYTEFMIVAEQQGNDDPTFPQFRNYLAAVMALYGLNINSPYEQGPPDVNNPVYPSWRDALLQLLASWH